MSIDQAEDTDGLSKERAGLLLYEAVDGCRSARSGVTLSNHTARQSPGESKSTAAPMQL